MKLFLASKNNHKIEEFKRILNPLGIELLSEVDLEIPLNEVDETGTTFEENAYLKAQSALEQTGLPSIADDSGLCVDFLDGQPGIYSARFAGLPVDNAKNNEKLLSLLDGVPFEKRTARFVCSIICVLPNGEKISSFGKCEGHILTAPKGKQGFGYDPLFESEVGCFGEISDPDKDSVSHRGRALKDFSEKIRKYFKEV